MNDEILKSYLDNFIKQNQLEAFNRDECFEKFVNYNVISKLYPRDFDFEDASVGGADDIGLDGVAIIVNGNIIKDEDEIIYLKDKNGVLNVTFALIQSKSSPKFKSEQIGNYIFGIKSFFDDKPSLPENERIQALRILKEKVYKYSIDFEKNPELKLFFVTTGEWKEPEQITGKVYRELEELDKKSLFQNKASIEFYDAERLKATYKELSRKVVKEIPFNNHVSLPDMPQGLNVRQSFIGSIPVNLYLELISDNEGKLSKELFFDNVRDFQGNNSVNQEIHETLISSQHQALLALLNNGITIIAKKVEKIGSKLKLTDFQIVNGCQSSHVLFSNKGIISPETHIILKVIETIDPEITNKIIRATNRQTEVKDEAFESLKPFHKNLEEYYKAMALKIKTPIYYERRSKEYLGHPKIEPWQVVTLASQIKSYISTVLSQPQSTHRYFGELLTSNKEKLFKNQSELNNYYLSALILNRLEQSFRLHKLYAKYKPFRYHILYLSFYVLKHKADVEKLSFENLIIFIDDLNNIVPIFIDACKKIQIVLKKYTLSNYEATKSRDFTQKISM